MRPRKRLVSERVWQKCRKQSWEVRRMIVVWVVRQIGLLFYFFYRDQRDFLSISNPELNV